MPHLASLSPSALEAHLAAEGAVAPSRARALVGPLLRHAFGARFDGGRPTWDDVTLPRWARGAVLALDVAPTLRVVERALAADGTLRLLLAARDGALVEAVLIPGPSRTTLCVSSQVGCARGCRFCETGRLGLTRQLEAAEIVDQVRLARAEHARDAWRPPLTNVVFMGMGEPLDNLARVADAIALLSDPRAFGLAPARITVSTVGVADKIAPFVRATGARLALSLNAPDDARRRAIMPVADRCDLASLRRALAEHVPRSRRLLVAYVLFDGWNDAEADADLVAAFVEGLGARVNLIAANAGPDPSLRAPPERVVAAFHARLVSHGVTTLLRHAKGRDVWGACGQLAGAARLAGSPPEPQREPNARANPATCLPIVSS